MIFEFEKEANSFHNDEDFGNYDVKKQYAVAEQFKALRLQYYPAGRMLVVFSSFRPIAMAEAYIKIKNEDIQLLIKQITYQGLWDIPHNYFTSVIFLYTEKQVKEVCENGLRKILSEMYFRILTKYDEFGYFDAESFSIAIDSKENFDTVYKSNWFYDSRDH